MAELSAVAAIAHRDFVKLLRDRVRIVGDLSLPLLLVLLLGPALQAGFGEPGGIEVTTFVFTGVLAQSVWQSATLGLISLVADREEDFSQEIFVSPISRYAIVAGKILGESLVALPQAIAILVVGFVIGVPMTPLALVALLPVVLLTALFGGAFGLLVLSNLRSQRTASQVFPFVLLPQFFLAGVFNPVDSLPLPLAILSALSPMRYAVELVRGVFYTVQPDLGTPPHLPLEVTLAVMAVAGLAFITVGTRLFVRSERNR